MDVALVHWPAEEPRRTELSARSRPRILLVDHSARPPEDIGLLEDWVRVPADPDDVKARVRALWARYQQVSPAVPSLSDDGILRHGSGAVHLTPLESRVIRPLVERYGSVVDRATLTRFGWPGEQVDRNLLDVLMRRIRRRLGRIALEVRTVRSRGYMLVAGGGDPYMSD